MRSYRAVVAALATTALLSGGTGCDSIAAPPVPTPAPPVATDVAGQLNALTVAAPHSMRGYSRARFPHWRETGANCNVRDSVLRRDGSQVRLSGCNVVAGRWYSPYDGATRTDPKAVEVDHVVALANAWRSGADTWDDQRRGDFANDLDRPQLRAASTAANRAKGDQDPAQWRPPNRGYWCQYAKDWVAVKYFWRLTVTAAEKTALTEMLGTCQ